MKKLYLPLLALTASLGLASGAEAATITGSLNVSAAIVPACSVSATPVNFGSMTGFEAAYANGDVTVNCSPGVPYNIAMDAGLHWRFEGRWLHNGTDDKNYILSASPNGPEWGDQDFDYTALGFSVADIGNGTSQPHTVYGKINAGSIGMQPGVPYTDTVTVTVHY